MLNKLKDFFNSQLQPTENDEGEAVNTAACALLFEMIRSDYQLDDQELVAMRKAMITVLGIDDVTADALIELAEQEINDASDYYQFTRLINEHYSESQKLDLVRSLWMVAFADGHLDKYEEHYLRRITELIYVPHSKFIQTKLEVQKQVLRES